MLACFRPVAPAPSSPPLAAFVPPTPPPATLATLSAASSTGRGRRPYSDAAFAPSRPSAIQRNASADTETDANSAGLQMRELRTLQHQSIYSQCRYQPGDYACESYCEFSGLYTVAVCCGGAVFQEAEESTGSLWLPSGLPLSPSPYGINIHILCIGNTNNCREQMFFGGKREKHIHRFSQNSKRSFWNCLFFLYFILFVQFHAPFNIAFPLLRLGVFVRNRL